MSYFVEFSVSKKNLKSIGFTTKFVHFANLFVNCFKKNNLFCYTFGLINTHLTLTLMETSFNSKQMYTGVK